MSLKKNLALLNIQKQFSVYPPPQPLVVKMFLIVDIILSNLVIF